MSDALLPLALLVPLVLAAGLWFAATARLALRLAPVAALPALLLAVIAPEVRLDIPWLLLGASLGLDETRRLFLLFTAGLWLAAGIYAGTYHAHDARRRAYFTFHLITLAGNLALIVALDAASFYLGFVAMSFAAYGMVVHAGSDEARRAARVYIVLVLVGEAMILPGLWSAVAHAPTTLLADVAAGALAAGPLTIALLALGLAVKAGAVPLHMWLPLAHPAAPTPASAILSGAMIKAGVLGWMGLLPVGLVALDGLSTAFILGGLLNAFYGAAIGLCQTRPKTVLAYSSISQMGFIMIALGVAASSPEAAPAALLAATVYCLHHGLAKGALFLGVGVVEHAAPGRGRNLVLAALAVPALALAGAPLTSGFAAKLLLKETAYGLDWLPIALLLGLAALGTTLLMFRFMARMMAVPDKAPVPAPGLWVPWTLLIVAGLAAAWLPALAGPALAALADPAALWSALWPIATGLALSVAALAAGRRWLSLPSVPEGDLIAPIGRSLRLGEGMIAIWQRHWVEWRQRRKSEAEPSWQRLRRSLLVRYLRREESFAADAVIALNLIGILAVLIVAIALR